MTLATTGVEHRAEADADPAAPTADATSRRADARHAAPAPYRADVDGLRAIAVALTIAFHLDAAGWLRGGFVGVDVFFVISGFLITGLLLRELRGGTYSLAAFYERRVRRIVPALTALVVLVLAGGWVLLLPGDYRQMARSGLWALGAAANRFFLDNTGYFDAAATSMPLLHTWSLGVEEQFYFVWPVLLLILFKAGRGRRSVVGLGLVAVVAASFVVNVRTIAVAPKAAFFLLRSRAWELGAGGLLALCPVLGRGRAPGWLAEALPVAGLLLIACAAATLSSTQPYPGYDALMPVLGASMIVYESGRTTLARRLLAVRPLVFLGRISYSLYLVNWPLIVFWRLYSNRGALTPLASTVLVAVSVVLAWASWWWVEQPLRRSDLPRHTVFLRAGAMAGVAAAAAWAVVATDGAIGRIPESARGLGDLTTMWKWACPENPSSGLPSALLVSSTPRPCIVGAQWETARSRAIAWGDSFTEHLLPILDVAGREAGTAIFPVLPCPAIFDDASLRRYWPDQPLYNKECAVKRAATLRFLEERDDVGLVILSSSWATLVGLLQRDDGTQIPRSEGIALMAGALDHLLDELAARGRRVLLFADTPRLPLPDPAACGVARVSPLLRDCPPDLGVVAWVNLQTMVVPTHHMLAEVAARHPNTTVWFPEDHLCRDGRCDVEVNGEFLYRDGGHLRRNLTPDAVRALTTQLQLADVLRSAAGSGAPRP